MSQLRNKHCSGAVQIHAGPSVLTVLMKVQLIVSYVGLCFQARETDLIFLYLHSTYYIK